MSDASKVSWSQVGDSEWWEPSDGGAMLRLIKGTEFVAGPFATPEEAHKAMELLMMEPEGTA